MRRDVKHKIVEYDKSKHNLRYERNNFIDVATAPHREAMRPNHNKWNRWAAIDFGFILRLVESYVGKSYDHLYSDIKRLCTKNRWQDQYVVRYIKQHLSINDPIIEINGRLFYERAHAYQNGIIELSNNDLYVDKHNIIRRYNNGAHQIKQKQKQIAREQALQTEFISDGLWFKKINDTWFVADITFQTVVHVKLYNVGDNVSGNLNDNWATTRPQRTYPRYGYSHHAYSKTHIRMMDWSESCGRVFDIDHNVFISYRLNGSDSILAINKRTCPKWMVQLYCKQHNVEKQDE